MAARRSSASSRLRDWLRSSCATARTTGPSLEWRRAFCASSRVVDASTSKIASTRVSVFWACCPPGPLEREVRSLISPSGIASPRRTRIDSGRMAAILLDIDGVLHVSGEPVPGGGEAVRALRADGHRLRFVTNNTTRARARARRRAPRARHRAGSRRADDDPGRRRAAPRRDTRARADDGRRQGRSRRRGRARRAGCRGRPPRRRRRERRDCGRVRLREPEPRVCGARGWSAARLPAPEPVVADGARAAPGRRRLRRGARVRRRRRSGGDREADARVLRRSARGARTPARPKR